MKHRLIVFFFLCGLLPAQEASSGFDLRSTVSASADYTHQVEGSPITGGFRAMLYPTWKLSQHWTVSGAVQIHSEKYFFEEFSDDGHEIKTQILQASLNYSRFWRRASMQVRLGQLSSAFGSFLLRYDDADNYLIDMPMAYGYYYKPVSSLALTGAQVDVTAGKFDARAQFVNSSAANPRSVFDRDQYGNWAGGAGYTIRQGLRVGVSGYRGPYLDREFAFFFPGEAKPKDLPASAYGVDVALGHGPWNIYGEWQHFRLEYRAIPTVVERTGYVESRRVLHPRWYVAARAGYIRSNVFAGHQAYEIVGGFRPNRHQLVKFGYEIEQGPEIRGTLANTCSIQLVTTFHPISVARE